MPAASPPALRMTKAAGSMGTLAHRSLTATFPQVGSIFRPSRRARAWPRASRPRKTLRRRKPLHPARSFDCGRFAPFAQDDKALTTPRASRPRKTLPCCKPLPPARSFDSARLQARYAQDDKKTGSRPRLGRPPLARPPAAVPPPPAADRPAPRLLAAATRRPPAVAPPGNLPLDAPSISRYTFHLRPSGGMADAAVSKTAVERRASSNLASGTMYIDDVRRRSERRKGTCVKVRKQKPHSR